jgi:hypothetical protein
MPKGTNNKIYDVDLLGDEFLTVQNLSDSNRKIGKLGVRA